MKKVFTDLFKKMDEADEKDKLSAILVSYAVLFSLLGAAFAIGRKTKR